MFFFPRISKDAEKEMSVLLNMYKVIPKDQRDKAALLQSEAKLRSEVTELRSQLTSLQSNYNDLQSRYSQLQRECRTASSSVAQTTKLESTEQSDLPERKGEGISAEPSPQEGPSTTTGSHQSASPSITAVVSPEGGEKSIIGSGPSLPPPPPPPPPPTPHPLMPPVPRRNSVNLEEEKKAWQIAELQIELQHAQRRCHALEQRVNTLQQHLGTARQQEDVMLKEMEVRRVVQ